MHFSEDRAGSEQDLKWTFYRFAAGFFRDIKGLLMTFDRAFGCIMLGIITNVLIFSATTCYIGVLMIAEKYYPFKYLLMFFNFLFLYPFPIKLLLLCYSLDGIYEQVSNIIKI